MYGKDEHKKWTFIRGCSLPAIALLMLLAIFLSGCSAEGFLPDEILPNFHSSRSEAAAPAQSADILTLVNPWNSLDKDYVPQLASLNDGTELDERSLDALISLLEDCREAGNAPYVCSAYRSWETQSSLYEDKVGRIMASGTEENLARIEAARVVAKPGTSEHQLGLAFDIIDSSYTVLDEAQADTPTQKWLMENSWRYGFILRYPEGKSEITGIIYEPWHYRYVGTEAAEDIYKSGLCFEEWLEEK
ncbi:MAG: D-alanyl-D-alanine carboxypeptidase family protein [Ruminococcaceae bacterium]|nr:D-alanyl-D-alanine carboxypeptidase family protein [Oscillospiraceae bacterium]